MNQSNMLDGTMYFDAEWHADKPGSCVLIIKGDQTPIVTPILGARDNNEAEWVAANRALQEAAHRGWHRFHCIGDSKLVIDDAENLLCVVIPGKAYAKQMQVCKKLSLNLKVVWSRLPSRDNPAGREIRRRQAQLKHANNRVAINAARREKYRLKRKVSGREPSAHHVRSDEAPWTTD